MTRKMAWKLIALAAAAAAALMLRGHVALLAGTAALAAAVLSLHHFVIVPRVRAWDQRMAVSGPRTFRDKVAVAVYARLPGRKPQATPAAARAAAVRNAPPARPARARPAAAPGVTRPIPVRRAAPRQRQPGDPAGQRPAATPRAVQPPPPFRGAPAAGPAGAELTANAPVPAVWAAVADWIRSQEPADQGEHLEFFSEFAAGAAEVSEAIRDHGDMQLNVIGIDPAAVAGTLDLADSATTFAEDAIRGRRRYQVIFAELNAWKDDGHDFPHDSRTWFSEGAA